LIEKWKKEDKLFYDKTGGFTAVLEMVQSKNHMTIIGGPGSGKTVTARHIALQLEKKGWEVVPVCILKDINKYGDRNRKQVFVLDDVVGVFAVDINICDSISTYKELIFTTIGGTSKLLFTCRKSFYKEAFKLGLFVTENVVDLQSKTNQLTETEKMAICQYYCKSEGLSPDLYTSLSFTKANHMFPFLCKQFSLDKKYQRLGESFFNKPFEYFIEELNKLHTIQYAVLVLCLVNKGKLSVECLPPEHMQREVFDNCGINLGTPKKNITDAIYHMSETYFTKLETEYTFTHDFIFEVIAYHYGCQNNKHQILKYLSSSYIANKVTVYEVAPDDLCIHISEDMYLALAKRLYTDIQSVNLFDVFINKSLKHGPFLDVFAKMLKTKPFDEFKSLILGKCQNIRHFVKSTLSVNKSITETIDIIQRDRLHLLFGRVFNVNSATEYNVKVISWIINYGHTQLLEEIVNHVECSNLSISLVFGSDIMENTRLLLLGCHSNTLDMVKLILKYVDRKCIDIEFTSSCASRIIGRSLHTYSTPLIVACSIGNLCIVKALLGKHAAINKCNGYSESPLFTAINHEHMDIVKYLLSSGADINLGKERGQSPLLIASQRGHCDVVKCLHGYGADINLRDEGGLSPLFEASYHGHFDVVKWLLSTSADINLRSNFGQSPLIVASQRGHCDVVKSLFSYGADINVCDNFGQSPFFVASYHGHVDVVEFLSSSGADINLSDKYEQSPLFVASHQGHCDVVKCLLSSGADINVCDNCGQSPLFVASYHGHVDVVKSLLSPGVDINILDNSGQSPLFVASSHGHCDIVKCLFDSGAHINVCDNFGQSPLFVASQRGLCDVVKCLLSSGADINVRCIVRQSPLFVASEQGHYDVVKCLLSFDADINVCDIYGHSPLIVASQRGHLRVAIAILHSHIRSVPM
jgi:ankyrin repeat protein